MEIKENKCTKCYEIKLINQFYKRLDKPTGYASWCIACLKAYNREYKQRKNVKLHKKQYNQTIRVKKIRRKSALKYYYKNKIAVIERHKKYHIAWVNYFKQKHGENPKCEGCGAKLNWGKGNGKYVVFDHRHGKGAFKQSPMPFCWSHFFNDKNKAIWEKEDFGIVCQKCNSILPTDVNDRKQYILKLFEYVYGINGLNVGGD